MLCNVVAEWVFFDVMFNSVNCLLAEAPWLCPGPLLLFACALPAHSSPYLPIFSPLLLLQPQPAPPSADAAPLCSSLLPLTTLFTFTRLPSVRCLPCHTPPPSPPPLSFYLCIFTSSRSPSSPLLWSTTHSFNPLPVPSTGVEVMGLFCLKLSPRSLNSRREKQYLPCLCSLLPTQPCCNVVTRAERRQKLSWLNLSRSLFF